MLNKVIKTLLVILFVLLPLINSHLFDLFGIKWGFYVDGNYEFTKVIFFNIFSGVILTLFFIKLFLNKSKIIIPKILILLSIILVLSSIFSSYFLTSIFGENGKGHGILMFLNLIGLFIILINSEKKYLKDILKYSILGSILVIFIGFKEYFFPTFDYGNLSNRAISTFGHPNYLALYLLIFIPFLINGIKSNINKIILLLLITLLILTKSVWGILIFIMYGLYLIYNKNKQNINKKFLYAFSIIGITILGLVVYKFGLLTKLNSFISRFYIWETTLNIIFTHFKSIIFGLGADSLSYTFDIYKSPELYIFENIGYTANRPHNLILNIFYHFGILGTTLILFISYKLIKYTKNTYYKHTLILFLLFTIFNFSSIANYIIIILVGSIIYVKQNNLDIVKRISLYRLIPYILISIIGVYGSIILYAEEYNVKLDKGYYSENKYYNEYILENPQTKAIKERHSVEEACLYLLKAVPSVENYFYCGNLFWNFNEKEAINNYKKGLELLPDMWNKNSKYYDNIFSKNLFVSERFYSEKFSNLKEILDRISER